MWLILIFELHVIVFDFLFLYVDDFLFLCEIDTLIFFFFACDWFNFWIAYDCFLFLIFF